VRELTAQMSLEGPADEVAAVEDRFVELPGRTLSVRIYRPVDGPERPGVLVWLHGGGWVFGSVAMNDTLCERLCNSADVIVISVDYRLAPEHKFPAAVQDAWEILGWAARHADAEGGDPEKLAIGGSSSGGNLAAVVALMASDARTPTLRHQLLLYPATDLTLSHASYESNSDGFVLTAGAMRWFRQHYLPTTQPADDWRVSPLFAPDLTGLPSAHVITAEYDVLCDEGSAYAERLRVAGVPTVHDRYLGVIHNFAEMGAVSPIATEAIDRAASIMKGALDGPESRSQ
ncbi:MAG TPA: alpha/beta hydrolase, partial [Ilumatobacter sp.]|nr:alpha/beta hydrolase [Ilumatobacter sp.]